MFTENDVLQIKLQDLDIEKINSQINYFKSGFPELNIYSAATPANGIKIFSPTEISDINRFYEKSAKSLKIVKFVPASGAASRMFKSLLSFRNKNLSPKDQLIEMNSDQSTDSVFTFINNIAKFAFYDQLLQIIKRDGFDLSQLIAEGNLNIILDYVLTEKGLNYANKPKALLKFHNYGNFMRTSLGEHLAEAALYATSNDGICRLHFTVSEEHLGDIKHLIKQVKPYYTKYYTRAFDVKFSLQHKSTDTIAADSDNNVFRDSEGKLVFRPGGHGALIENLNKVHADIIFVKNIDNVVPDHLKDETVTFKKLLAGHLLVLREKIYYFLDILDNGDISPQLMASVRRFMEKEFSIIFPPYFAYLDLVEKAEYLFILLNRPIRVCGMVKNEGEPGGGPFLVADEDDTIQLQILESSQFNFSNENHKKAFESSTHFNPVDMVLSVYDYKGNKFNLKDFVNHNTGFISSKSKDGRELKALELPGLWNGAMHYWNTAFIEVPLSTFNPVKIVNDLLRPQHQ